MEKHAHWCDSERLPGRFWGRLSELYQCVVFKKEEQNSYNIFNLVFLILMAHGSCELHVQFLQFSRFFGIFTVQVLWLGGIFGQILTKRSHKSFELFELWFPMVQCIESTCKFCLELVIFITPKILRSIPQISKIFYTWAEFWDFRIIEKSREINLCWGQNISFIFTYSVWRAFLLTFSCEASFRYSDSSPSSCWTFWFAVSAVFWWSCTLA